MHHDLVQGWSGSGVASQDSRNQISGLVRNWNVLWERVLVSLDSSVRGFHISGLEWRLAYNQGVDDDSEGPDVDLIAVACPALQHFRSDVVGSSANGPLLLAFKIEFGCEAKVSKLNKHFVIQKEVAQFEITVDDPMGMQVLESVNDLRSVTLHLQLVETLSSLEELIETLVLAKLEKNVNTFRVLEEVHELADVRVLDGTVDLDLGHQLLLSPAPL